jgi:protein-disulfide isomerase
MHMTVGRRIGWVLALVALLAAVGVGCSNTQEAQPTTGTQATPGAQSTLGAAGTPTVQPTPKTITIDAGNNPSKGPPDAKVTIVEFSDFQGPNCGNFAEQTLPQILANYGNEVRFVFMNFPLKKDAYAQKAGEAGECANAQGSFWRYHDLLFQNQKVLTDLLAPDPVTGLAKVVEKLKGYAAQLGLNTAAFNECLDSGLMAAAVRADDQVAQKVRQDAGLTSFPVPAFFINGNYLHGAKPYAVFKQAIDAALAAAG